MAVGTEEEGGGGGQGGKAEDPPLHPAEEPTNRWRVMRPERVDRRWGRQRTSSKKRRRTGTDRPHWGAPVKVTRMGAR